MGYQAAVRVWIRSEVCRREDIFAIWLELIFSYTTFEMSGLNLTSVHRKDQDSIQPTREKYLGSAGLYDVLVCVRTVPIDGAPLIDQYIAQVNVSNTGKVAGAEVAQLVITSPTSAIFS